MVDSQSIATRTGVEESRLWAEYSNNQTAENRNRLVEFYYSWVTGIARGYAIPRKLVVDECLSTATMALYKFLDRFDPSLSVPFKAYAFRGIRGSLLDEGRRVCSAREQSVGDMFAEEDSKPHSDTTVALEEMWAGILSTMPSGRPWWVAYHKLVFNRDVREVASILGCSKTVVGDILSQEVIPRAKEFLRETDFGVPAEVLWGTRPRIEALRLFEKRGRVRKREIWLPTMGFENWYEVSHLGRVRRVKAAYGTHPGRVRKTHVTRRGRAVLCLSVKQRHTLVSVHSLVADVFLGVCPADKEICHINGDKADCRAVNLKYVTKSEQSRHIREVCGFRSIPPVLRGEKNPKAKLTFSDVVRIRALLKSGRSAYSIAKEVGMCQTSILNIKQGKTWKHVPHIVERAELEIAPRAMVREA